MAVVCHYATFNIVSVIYLTCAVGKRGGGGQEAHALCHLQILFQSFTTPVLYAGGGAFMSLMFYATFDNVSVIYHISAVGRVLRRLMFYATFNIQSFTTPLL
jgi:hypothetical protein